MVAGLHRLDDLSGTKIAIELPGQVDGPSAGGVICLAIRAALDGRDFPADFTMTGSIMPDGTIGSVGGIAIKMVAAVKAGAKRIAIPAYLRFERDLRSGEEIDLKRLAASLKLELVTVENISQAMRAAYGLDPKPAAENRSVHDLPEAMEELLKQRYQEDATAGAKLWDAIAADERKQIAAEPFSQRLFVIQRERSENAFRSGRLTYAALNIRIWHLFLDARRNNQAIFGSLKGENFQANLAQLDTKLQELIKAIPAPSSQIAATGKAIGDPGIQLCADYYDGQGLLAIAFQLQGSVDKAVADMAKPENKDDNRQKALIESIANWKAFQLMIAHCVLSVSRREIDDVKRIAGALPHAEMSGEASLVERMFYSAWQAAENTFGKDVVKSAATALQASDQNAVAMMANADVSLEMYLNVSAPMALLHSEWSKGADPKAYRFGGAAAAHVYANGLSQVSSLITRWSELDVKLVDGGGLRYGRTDLLNYLLSNARENAVASIAECQRRNLPCITPIISLEDGDLRRDDVEADKVNVLQSYWNASLQAKVLLMLFSERKH
jgi:hypothetical protein